MGVLVPRNLGVTAEQHRSCRDRKRVGMPNEGNSPLIPPPPPTRAASLEQRSAAIKNHLAKLASAAQTLNDLSDQLTKEVTEIETALNKLNLGIWAHVNAVTLDSSDDGLYSHGLQLVYGKSGGKWGFLIDEYREDANYPDQGERESWAFKDAPRDFRLKVVDKIPALLEALVKRSAEVTSEITMKVRFANELALTFILNGPSDSKK